MRQSLASSHCFPITTSSPQNFCSLCHVNASFVLHQFGAHCSSTSQCPKCSTRHTERRRSNISDHALKLIMVSCLVTDVFVFQESFESGLHAHSSLRSPTLFDNLSRSWTEVLRVFPLLYHGIAGILTSASTLTACTREFSHPIIFNLFFFQGFFVALVFCFFNGEVRRHRIGTCLKYFSQLDHVVN